MTTVFLTILTCIWAVFGTWYYNSLSERVTRKVQKAVLILIGGPIVWSFKVASLFIFMPINYLDMFVEKFEMWLKKT
jgi:hypothetical protein